MKFISKTSVHKNLLKKYILTSLLTENSDKNNDKIFRKSLQILNWPTSVNKLKIWTKNISIMVSIISTYIFIFIHKLK